MFIDLRGYSKRGALTSREALGQALRTLRVPSSRLPVDEDELAALYRSRLANKRMLIVLDDAEDPRQVYPLLPGTSSCVVIVTARLKFTALVARCGARAMALDLLSEAEALDLVGEVAGRERTRQEPDATAALVQICARLPLALRVAAANIATRPQQSVADTVHALAEGDRLSKLALGEDPGEAVGAAFDLSYRGSSRRHDARSGSSDSWKDRTSHRRRSVHSSGPHRRRHDGSSICWRRPASSRPSVAAATTCTNFCASTRKAARLRRTHPSSSRRRSSGSRCGTSPPPSRQERFLDRYRRTIRQELTAPPVNPNPAERAGHLDWFASEQPNLTALIRQVARLGWNQVTWELADAVYDFFELRRHCHENLEVHRLGLEAAEHGSNPLACFFMHHHISVSHRELGQTEEALRAAEAALQLSIQLEDRYGQAAVLDNLARTHLQLSDYRTALDLGKQAWSSAATSATGTRRPPPSTPWHAATKASANTLRPTSALTTR